MNLEKRVEQLELRAGTSEFVMLIICRFESPQDKGPREVIGYSEMGRSARTWTRGLGESVDAMKARVEAQLQAEGVTVAAVCEEHAAVPDPTAA